MATKVKKVEITQSKRARLAERRLDQTKSNLRLTNGQRATILKPKVVSEGQ